MNVLASRPFRSVLLDPRAPNPHVRKRFHHPHPLLARFDRARARREARALLTLEQAGLPVPRVLGLQRSGSGWELCLTVVPGARTLARWLEDPCAPPGGWPRLATRMGALLARLQLAGWEHGDLHPGNVLVDQDGAPWLIDLQRARRVPLDPARCLAELVTCAAHGREVLAPRARARFLAAWLATLPAELRPGLEGALLLGTLEARARVRRAELVRIGLNRWLRESSRVRAGVHEGHPAWIRRDLDEEALASPRAGWITLHGHQEELRARWLGAARLHEHGLAVARPAVLVRGSRWLGRGTHARFELPAQGAPSASALLADLAERGLVLRAAELTATPQGVCWLPPREPEDFVDR